MTRCTEGLPEAGGTEQQSELIIEKLRRCLFVAYVQQRRLLLIDCHACESLWQSLDRGLI